METMEELVDKWSRKPLTITTKPIDQWSYRRIPRLFCNLFEKKTGGKLTF